MAYFSPFVDPWQTVRSRMYTTAAAVHTGSKWLTILKSITLADRARCPMLIESTQSHLQTQFDLTTSLRRVDACAAVVGAGGAPWTSAAGNHLDGALLPTDRFLIYSLSKTFIACVILQLVEQGSLDIDGLVGLWMPELPFAYQITIRQLLNHTSGLPDYGAMESYQQSLKQRPQEPWTDDEFISYSCGYRLRSTPGREFNYSNIGYMYLRLLIQSITGLSFADALRERIFQPLSLKSTTVQRDLEDQKSIVATSSRYVFSEDGDLRSLYHPGWVAHGLIASTALDVATFYYALLSPDELLLNADSLEEMRRLVPVKDTHRIFRNPGYGLGLMGEQRHSGDIYGHTGSGPGFGASAYVLLDRFSDPLSTAVLVCGENAELAEVITQDLLNIARTN